MKSFLRQRGKRNLQLAETWNSAISLFYWEGYRVEKGIDNNKVILTRSQKFKKMISQA